MTIQEAATRLGKNPVSLRASLCRFPSMAGRCGAHKAENGHWAFDAAKLEAYADDPARLAKRNNALKGTTKKENRNR